MYRADQPIMTENVTTTAEGDSSTNERLSMSHRNESGEYRVSHWLPNACLVLSSDRLSTVECHVSHNSGRTH